MKWDIHWHRSHTRSLVENPNQEIELTYQFFYARYPEEYPWQFRVGDLVHYRNGANNGKIVHIYGNKLHDFVLWHCLVLPYENKYGNPDRYRAVGYLLGGIVPADELLGLIYMARQYVPYTEIERDMSWASHRGYLNSRWI